MLFVVTSTKSPVSPQPFYQYSSTWLLPLFLTLHLFRKWDVALSRYLGTTSYPRDTVVTACLIILRLHLCDLYWPALALT